MARLLLLVGSLVLVACGSEGRTRAAFNQVNDALPPQLQRIASEGETGRSVRYEARGEAHEVARAVRSSLVAHGFALYEGSGLPDPSVTWPSVPQPSIPSGATPANLGPPDEPPVVDAIQISGFRGERDIGIMRSVYFLPASRPGWTVVVVTTAPQD